MTRARTQAREAALKALYMLDLRGDVEQADIDALVREEVQAPDARAFARELVDGVRARRDDLDREIEAVALNWSLGRMAAVDRNILRIGCFELLWRPDLPPAVTINEAVLMAKKYSTKESGAFVNGILDKIHQNHPEAVKTDSPE